MKTKQKYMVAKFTNRHDCAMNDNGKRELSGYYKLIDKKTEKTIVDCRLYMGRSASASAVHCSLWVQSVKGQDWADGYTSTSGKGSAGGYGYHKSSAAVASAISSAGIELWGSPYGHPVNQDTPAQTRKLLKSRAHIGGCGQGSVEVALSAIAYAAGYPDCILVRG